MIIDINAFLGHYPFRRLPHNSARTMIELMDAHGIDSAVVSSLHSVFYRDAHRGNEDLFLETKDFGSRFVRVATVNPKYVSWRRDLDEAMDRWKMKAVTLFPAHHGYLLSDVECQQAIEEIVRRDIPLVLTQRLEDRRQRHHWDAAEDLEFKSVLELVRQHTKLRLALVNWIGLDGKRMAEAGLQGRCLIDFARLHVLLNKDVDKLISSLGITSIAFGTHMPFDYVGPSLVKLANLESNPAIDYPAVSWRNAARFFGLEGGD